jgi:hypothetical protein
MPLGGFRQSLYLSNKPSGPWTATLSTSTISNMNMLTAFHNVAIHGITNGHLVGTVGYQEGTNNFKSLLPWVYDISSDTLVLGSPVLMTVGRLNGYMRTAANGANGMTWHYNSTLLKGYRITNYASITTSTLPTLSITSAFEVGSPFAGGGSGDTGLGLAVDRVLDRYLPMSRSGGDRSSYRPVSYTHSNTYNYAFAANVLSANGVGSGRASDQQILAVPGSNVVAQIVDDPNGNNTFVNIAGSTSERGFNFYGSALGFNGQACRISYSGSGDTATATLVMTGTLGATSGSYRYRRLSITGQDTGSFLDSLTTVTLENGFQDYRVYDNKPNTSTDYLVLYRNANTMYAAKVSSNSTSKTEYGAIIDTQGYNSWSSNDSFLDNGVVYTANLLYNGTTGKILITKFIE